MQPDDYDVTTVAEKISSSINKMNDIEVERVDVRRKLADAERVLFQKEINFFRTSDRKGMAVSRFDQDKKLELLEEKYEVDRLKSELSRLNGEFNANETVTNNIKALARMMGVIN